MLKVILSGCCGRMGNVVADLIANRDDCEIVCGVDKVCASKDFPIYPSFDDLEEKADVIIDFSHISTLPGLLKYATKTKTAVVLATTGFNEEQTESIKAAGKEIPVFFSFNMSLGVNLLIELSKKAAAVLNGFDIEIIEKHHNQKLDAPSGTAVMIANGLNEVLDNKMKHEYDRHCKREKRAENEIGIHSVRGGTIVGEHEVLFCGRDEIVSISHSARSREIFAVGAVNAALFLKDKKPGLYSMKELVESK